jgi:pyruvate/2-oxoglutarate dehydrogenase complex dihydrolipoamide dehydrogenase (E3) component
MRLARATFTDPEVASVGLTEVEFRAKFGGNSVLCSHCAGMLTRLRADKGVVMTRSLELVDRAVCENEEAHGFVKLMYDDHYNLHGATVVCQRAGELINELAVCIHHGIKVGPGCWWD